MRRSYLLMCITALVALAGCQTLQYQTTLSGGGGVHEDNAGFFFWGLVGEKVVDLDTVCPNGPARWKSQQTFVDGLIGAITLGIYTRRTITVECSNGTAYQVAPQDDGSYKVVSAQLVPERSGS